jgi:predicted O-methyltransferase YrrM
MTIGQLFQHRPRIFNLLHLFGLVEPVSQTHPEERACLCKHISEAHSAVEVGTYMAVTAAEMAQALPANGTLYCIDPYPNGDAIREIALRHLRRKKVSARVVMLFSNSEQSITSLPSSVDFFFVDGDHSYDGLLRDWQVVKQVIKVGGIAAFHDTAVFPGATSVSEGAVKCFNEVILHDSDYELIETCWSLNVIRRKS